MERLAKLINGSDEDLEIAKQELKENYVGQIKAEIIEEALIKLGADSEMTKYLITTLCEEFITDFFAKFGINKETLLKIQNYGVYKYITK